MKFMPFSDFYFSFKLTFFFLKITEKGFTCLQVLTWRAGPPLELTWHMGPPQGCGTTLRPRDRAADGPHKAHVAHKARTCGRRPRVSTRTPMRGATWQEGQQMEGPQVSWPSLGDWGDSANALPRPGI